MAIELHHLHPGHDDELSRLKARIAELEKLFHDLCERVTENDEIRLHWEEIEQTRAENERMKARIAELEKENAELKEQYRDMDVTHTVHIAKMNVLIEELEESQRWRKCSDEKPSEEGDYLVMARYPDDDEPHVEICFYDRVCEDFGHYERRYSGSDNSFGGFDDEEWVTHNVSFWRQLPSAPKEEK